MPNSWSSSTRSGSMQPSRNNSHSLSFSDGLRASPSPSSCSCSSISASGSNTRSQVIKQVRFQDQTNTAWGGYLNDDESRKSWYTALDYALLKWERKSTIQALRAAGGDATALDEAQHCVRGLEETGRKRLNRMKGYIHAVLQEQEMQRNMGIFDPTGLRAVSSASSQWAKSRALAYAAHDARVVANWLNETGADDTSIDLSQWIRNRPPVSLKQAPGAASFSLSSSFYDSATTFSAWASDSALSYQGRASCAESPRSLLDGATVETAASGVCPTSLLEATRCIVPEPMAQLSSSARSA